MSNEVRMPWEDAVPENRPPAKRPTVLIVHAQSETERGRVSDISAENYRALLQRMPPRYVREVRHALAADPDARLHVDVVLDVPTKDWPARIAAQVPVLSERLERIHRLRELKRLLIRRRDLQAAFAERLSAVTRTLPAPSEAAPDDPSR